MLRKTLAKIASYSQRFLLGLLWLYRHTFSLLLGDCCRFHPSCSNYAQIALKRFGIIRGMLLTCCRLLRCHPWHPGGIDEVPKVFSYKHCLMRPKTTDKLTADINNHGI